MAGVKKLSKLADNVDVPASGWIAYRMSAFTAFAAQNSYVSDHSYEHSVQKRYRNNSGPG